MKGKNRRLRRKKGGAALVTLIQVGRAQLGFARFWPRRAERALEVARQLLRSPNPTSERFTIDHLATLPHVHPGGTSVTATSRSGAPAPLPSSHVE